jgi:hypothetical protein
VIGSPQSASGSELRSSDVGPSPASSSSSSTTTRAARSPAATDPDATFVRSSCVAPDTFVTVSSFADGSRHASADGLLQHAGVTSRPARRRRLHSMNTCQAAATLTASERTFAHLWTLLPWSATRPPSSQSSLRPTCRRTDGSRPSTSTTPSPCSTPWRPSSRGVATSPRGTDPSRSARATPSEQASAQPT